MLYGNRLLAHGQIAELRALMNDIPHKIRLRCDRPRDLARALFQALDFEGIEIRTGGLEAHTTDPAALYRRLPAIIAESGVQVDEVTPDDVDLESVFAYLTR